MMLNFWQFSFYYSWFLAQILSNFVSLTWKLHTWQCGGHRGGCHPCTANFRGCPPSWMENELLWTYVGTSFHLPGFCSRLGAVEPRRQRQEGHVRNGQRIIRACCTHHNFAGWNDDWKPGHTNMATDYVCTENRKGNCSQTIWGGGPAPNVSSHEAPNRITGKNE